MDKTGRQPRIHIPNSIHHVMIRGNNRQRIFYGKDYFNRFFEILNQSESAKKLDYKIIAYCLMSNHAHLLVHVHDSSLSCVMQKINYRYARWVNHKDKRVGHLFQGRFRSLHVKNEEYLINLCRYIHLNPVAAKMVNSPADYLWSSHRYYLNNNFPSWMDENLMLSAIKNKTNLNYRDFMNTPVQRECWKPALYISETGDLVCNKDVIRDLQEDMITPQNVFSYLSEDVVSAVVCRELNIKKYQLIGSSKNRSLAQKRILLTHYLIRYSNKNITGIAKMFERTHGTLSRQLEKFTEQPEMYFSNELLERIERTLDALVI